MPFPTPTPHKRWITPPFLVAVVILGIGAVLAGPVARTMRLHQIKDPLPLRAPLSTLSEDALRPYTVLDRRQLEPAMVDALGTDQYIHWLMEDRSVAPSDPLRTFSLFITYYTGGRDLVPHTPDICQLGAGYQPAQPHENREITVAGLGEVPVQIPIRTCTFMRTAVYDRRKHSVIYTFYCNGRFVCQRNDVRLLINDLQNRYAFFSKVEVSFPRATREESVKGVTKLFQRLLPVLVDKHWPDFEAAEASAAERAES